MQRSRAAMAWCSLSLSLSLSFSEVALVGLRRIDAGTWVLILIFFIFLIIGFDFYFFNDKYDLVYGLGMKPGLSVVLCLGVIFI